MIANTSNFYLRTPMDRPEYMFIPTNLISHEMIEEYDIQNKIKMGKFTPKL